jgi:hypothetical protein
MLLGYWLYVRPVNSGEPKATGRLSSAHLLLEDVRVPRDSGTPNSPSHSYGKWRIFPLAPTEFSREVTTVSALPDNLVFTDKPLSGPCRQKRPGELGSVEIPFSWLAIEGKNARVRAVRSDTNSLGIALYHVSWRFADSLPANWRDFALKGSPPTGHSISAESSSVTEEICQSLYARLDHSGGITAPIVRFIIRNTSETPATILGITATPIRSFGGDSGAGGAEIRPVGGVTTIKVRYDKETTVDLQNPISLDRNTSTALDFRIELVDAARGEGPGILLFRLTMRYFDGSKQNAFLLGSFLMSDNLDELTQY